jgi:hypothetical protein
MIEEINKIHYCFIRKLPKNRGQKVYLCNWAVKPNEDKMSYDISKVTCKNCIRINNNFMIEKEYINSVK